jgi:hypothetical protein
MPEVPRGPKDVSALGAAAGLILLTMGSAARAQQAAWIAIRTAPVCQAAAANLERRVADTFIGRRAVGLRATVDIGERGAGYALTVEVRRGPLLVGHSSLVTPSCDEAVDAAVLVLALALGESTGARGESPSDTATRATSAPPAVERRALTTPIAPHLPRAGARRALFPNASAERGADGLGRGTARRPEDGAMRLSFMTGVDAGTLPATTAYVGLGMAWMSAALELRGAARYGLPKVEETADGARIERARHEFGAVDARGCYGVGTSWRLSSCVGSELGFVRREHRRAQRGVDSDTDAVAPRLSGVAAVSVAHTNGLIQPELELSTLAVALGRQEHAPWLAMRVGAGLAVQF